MAGEKEPLDVALDIGMYETVMSFASSPEPLDDGTIEAAETHIAQNGLGITRLKTVNKSTFNIEHGPEVSRRNIVLTLGYLAAQKIERPIRFVKLDGTEHGIQLEQEE